VRSVSQRENRVGALGQVLAGDPVVVGVEAVRVVPGTAVLLEKLLRLPVGGEIRAVAIDECSGGLCGKQQAGQREDNRDDGDAAT
jgi:hypothetical protein